MNRKFASVLLVALMICLTATAASRALTVPFTEDFAAGTANWKNFASLDVNHVATGGVDGGGYVSTEYAFTNAPMGSSVIFRGQDMFNSSGDAFVGNWLAAGIGGVSAYVRHNAPEPVSYYARLAPLANFPGALVELPGAVQPNTWTRLHFDIRPSNPLLTIEGPPSAYNSIFTALGNVQISARVPAGLEQDATPYNFDLDQVTIVPEPGSMGIILAGSVIGLAARRERRRGK
jgi:hypothetical protein